MLKIDQKIVGYDLIAQHPGPESADDLEQTSFLEAPTAPESAILSMVDGERLARPDPAELERMSEAIERQEEVRRDLQDQTPDA